MGATAQAVPCVYPVCGGFPYWEAESFAWIDAVHELANNASSIDYVVTVDIERVFGDFASAVMIQAWADGAAQTCSPEYSPFSSCYLGARWYSPVEDASPRTVTLSFSVTSDDGVVVRGPIGITVKAGVWTWADGSSLRETSHAHMQVVASSITAIVHPADPSIPRIQLDATGSKDPWQGKSVDLAWQRANSETVDIYRNGSILATVQNSGWYRDTITEKPRRTYVYQVCEADTTICSNEAVVEL